MKIVVLNGSPRKGGNTEIMTQAFAEAARKNQNEVSILDVAPMNIRGCLGCKYCWAHKGECVQKDDMAEILQKIIDADVLVLASPVYFYSIDAQLKAVIDRTVARWLEVKNKEFYYIATMADEAISSADRTINCFRGYADCVAGAIEKGVIIGNGVYERGTIKGHKAMQQAYEMGKNV